MDKQRFFLSLGISLFVLLSPGLSCADPPSGGDVSVSASETWPEGVYSLDSISVNNGATLTIAGGSAVNVVGAITVTGSSTILLQGKNSGSQVNGQWLGVGVSLTATDVSVEAGSKISADGQGYSTSSGPGAGAGSYQAASYGGRGGGTSTSIYGSALQPADPGSGGGGAYGGWSSGGGVIRLMVSGSLINNGIISANSVSSTGGNFSGGAGGSIWVNAGTLTGAGVFAAEGSKGDFNGYGGGGGRIAIYYATNSGFNLASISAKGYDNTGYYTGLPGSIVFVETIGNNLVLSSGQLSISQDSVVNFNDITLQNGSTLSLGGGSTLTAAGKLSMTGNATIIVQSKNNSGLVNGQWQGIGGTINAANVQIEVGSTISANGQGYYGNNCSGAGSGPGGGLLHCNNSGNGGSHGGQGGGPNTLTGLLYGSATEPADLGSGGSGSYPNYTGGAGGGAIRLIVTGTLTNNGIISANGNGAQVDAGGGSGGSLHITTSVITGSGSIAANGGTTSSGGGGGRVAVYYTTNNSFSPASITASPGGSGSGQQPGSPLFINSATNSITLAGGRFIVPRDGSLNFPSIALQNGSMLFMGGGSTLQTTELSVTGNSTIIVQSKNSTAMVNGQWQGIGGAITAAAVLIEAGSSISADSQGYSGSGCSASALGPGGGVLNCNNSGNGGSYGGLGGGPNQAAMIYYGSATQPVDLGSGGSGGYATATGGTGGGAIRLIVSGTLTNNGTISANGGFGPTNPGSGSSGGGSGGSLYITTATIAGSGSISANGGAGIIGGGGGRVALYYVTNSGFNPASLTASGGSEALPGSVLFINSSTNNLTLPGGRLMLAQDSSFDYNDIRMTNGAALVMGGGSTLNAAGTLSLTGNSVITLQAKNSSAAIVGRWLGQGATIFATNMSIDSGSMLTADGQGYPGTGCSGPGLGAGGGPLNCNNAGNGGSHGGLGGGPNKASMKLYGSADIPEELGSGGSGGYAVGSGSAGGGAIRLIVRDSLVHNGAISANGYNAPAYSGAGSGGSIYISTRTISGSGSVTARGGSSDNAGGGGRIALYYVTNSGFDLASPSAAGGTGAGSGQPGSLMVSNSHSPQFRWLKPEGRVLHGVTRLEWFAGAHDLMNTSVDLSASGPAAITIGTSFSAASGINWDTDGLPDGQYELRLTVRDLNGAVLAELPRQVAVINAPTWHTGIVSDNQTWSVDKLHLIEGDLIIPSGITVTIDPGTTIKAAKGARIIIRNGGTVIAQGTDSLKIVFTLFEDDTVGGDSNLDGSKTKPVAGDWLGFSIQGSGVFNSNINTDIRYVLSTQSGALSSDQVWLGTYVYHVYDDIVIPNGITLIIQPGAIIKFAPYKGITVQPGGRLSANGTLAQPIYFTSLKDDSVGGDSNGDGNDTTPSAGDWKWLYVNGAEMSLDHAFILYGGGNGTGSWNSTGVISTTGAAAVTVANSTIRDAFYDGILAWGGTVKVSNSVFTAIDRAICAHPGSPVTVINSTLINNRVGLLIHGGTLDVANSIVADSSIAGVQFDFGTLSSIRYTDVWTSVSGATGYSGIADVTGINGNISVDPRFKNKAQGDFRPNFLSPAIDAADGALAPALDIMGAPRYSDPRSTHTGIPAANGSYPDMGAFEFIETALSDLDLVASQVTGPASAIAGSMVPVSWTVTNIGTGYAIGPWHDSVYLVRNPDTTPVELLAGEVLVGSGVILGPGESMSASASFRVPGSIIGNHRWGVKTNSRGSVFEGVNSGNNSALSLDKVFIDLPELVLNATALSNSFTATGQAWWYKINAGSNRSVGVNLALGGSGAVRLFIGQGYLPDSQNFDYQQQEWNSVTASAAIPNTTSQVYYVTAYSQALNASNAAFTIGATSLPFTLSAVQPTSVSNSGSATIEFIGAKLRSDATYQIIGPDNSILNAASVFVADELHAYASFALAGLQAGSYTARVTVGGQTATLSNALTITAASGGSTAGGQIEFNLEVPAAVRAGFGGTVTVNYRNAGGTDAVAPLMWLTASGANMAQTPPSCTGCTASFATIYRTLFSSGDLLGIHFQGPAGVMPPGAQGSIGFDFEPTVTSGNVSFTLNTITDPDTPIDWNSLKDSLRPSSVSVDAWEPIFANFTASAGSTLGNYNAVLANNATYLSLLGKSEYRASQLYRFELEKAGLSTITTRYLLGHMGRGRSNAFDIWIETDGGAPAIHYPHGNMRAFMSDPDHPGAYLGGLGDYAVLSYDAASQNWTLSEQDGAVLHFIPDPGNATSRYVLDSSRDLNGNGITLTYTSNGLVASVVESPGGDTTTFTYNVQGRVSQTTDPVGRVSTYGYDSSGEHLLSVTNASGTAGFTYITGEGAAKEHAVQSVTFFDGTHLYFEYDNNGRLIRQYNDGGAQSATYSYDTRGTVTITDGVGNTTQLFPDEYGRVGMLADPLGAVTRLSYNSEQKLVGLMRPEGTFSSISYNSQGNPAGLRDALGNQQSLSYGAYGNLKSLTDSLGNTMSYDYDALYNLTGITYPDGSNEQASFDTRGNPLKWTNRRGRSISFTYDANNLLTAKTYVDGSRVSFTYDSHRNLITASNSSGTTSFSYDIADRLTGISYPNGRSIQYSYDGSGRRSRIADQSGFTVNYIYDSVGRLSLVTDGGGARIAAYSYDAAGRLTRKEMGNGTFTTFAYDAAANLLRLINYASTGAEISRFDYTYDALGRRVGMTTATGSWSFGYDAEGQITTVSLPGGSVQYTYDAAGNRITTNANGTAVDYNVNNLNQYTATGADAYRYDDDGNMTAGGGWTYNYDDENRLISMAKHGDAWVYEYDALGNRVAQTHNGNRTEYLIDPTGIGSILAEFDGSGSILAHYTYGIDLASSVPASGQAVYYHFDGSGNTAQITSISGGVLNSYSYLPFGERQTSTEAITNPFTYVGQYGVRDEGNGLYYMRHRWYSPVLGRFTQPDPIGLGGGDFNLYRYVSNSAMDFVDPLGLKKPAKPPAPWYQPALNWATNTFNYGAPGVSLYNHSGDLYNSGIQNSTQQGQMYDKICSSTGQVSFDTPGVDTVGGFHQGTLQSAAYMITVVAPGTNTAGTGATAGAPGFLTPLWGANSGIQGIMNYFWKPKPPGGSGKKLCTPPPPSNPPACASNKPTQSTGTAGTGAGCGPGAGGSSSVLSSYDPNAKMTVGFGDQGFIPTGTTLSYTIFFENQSAATAPALKVVVTDVLDAQLDWSTVQLSNIGFNNVTLNVPPGLQSYSSQTGVATDANPVSVSASPNPVSGTVTWTMQSVDPVTGGMPKDPLAGFLPPNNLTHRGEGFLTFTVRPKSALTNGAIITNQASIIFDVNAPIVTNTVTNTIDTVSPFSSVTALPATSSSTSFTASWTGSDQSGSGIAAYDIYVATDGGLFTPWLLATSATSATFTGVAGRSYGFYSIATDNVGHRQIAPVSAQATTTITMSGTEICGNGIDDNNNGQIDEGCAVPVDCAVSNWTDWGTCSAACGGGMQNHTRFILIQPANGGAACPALEESQACNSQPCPVDCAVSNWSEWGACSATCGGGTQSHTRSIFTLPANGGAACPILTETQVCNSQPCPVSCAKNVTASLTVTRSGFTYIRAKQRFVQTITIRNNGVSITGPVWLALDSLSSNATLFAAAGATGCAAPLGNPYTAVNVGIDGVLSTGEAVTATLEFVNPTLKTITYTTRVLAGANP